ncbi:MAG: serine/threonine-protein kinase [Pirellula sp.]
MNEETLFELALNTPSAEMPALLDRECKGDPALRGRIEKLLAAHSSSDATTVPPEVSAIRDEYDHACTHSLAPQPTDTAIGTILGGRYKLIQSIGVGGMGNVYMAQQTEPVKRMVAVKVIKSGMDSRAVLARFEAERQALAMMDHPNIAKVLDAGETDGGSPYFVMELVKGVPITKFCDEGKLTPKQRLELFLPICEAIQHSHQKGIIHRDIKPSNVLVAMYDDHAVPKVIDFGVAKATQRSLDDTDMITGFGALVGTPEYMSPEQASLNNLDIDTRSDVYSLGVLLYELLSGHTPVDRKSMEKTAIYEILRIVREVDPPLLSAKLSSIDTLPSVAANRRTEPKKLATQFRGELDWVLIKALEKDRSRRYSTASGLARDIQRYLSDEIVEARPPSTFYTLQKLVRRNRGQVLAAGLILLALLVGMAGTTWGLIRAEQRRVEAETARADEAEQREIAESNESKAVLAKEEESRQRAIADVEKQRAIEFRDKALNALRATTGEDVEKLIGEKSELTKNERAYLDAIAKRWQAFAAQEGTDQQSRAISGEGRYRVASLWDQLGRREDALREHEQAEKIYQELTIEFPQVTLYAQSLANNYNNIGLVLDHLGRRVEAQTKIRKALNMQEKLVNQFPAEADYRAELARTHHNLGLVSNALGNKFEAMESYRQGLDIEEKLSNEFPERADYRRQLATSHSNLGVLFADMGKHKEAHEQYRKSLAIREKLAADYPSEREHFTTLATSYSNYGNLLSKFGQPAEALKQIRNSTTIKEKLATDYPGVPEYSRSLATSYNNLGLMLRPMGKSAEAIELLRKALAIREKLATNFPLEPKFRQDLAAIHNNLANALREAEKYELALEQHHKAVTIREKLMSDFTAIPEYRKNVAVSYVNLGQVLRKMDKPTESEEYYRKALSLFEKLTTDFPELISYREDLASTYNSLGSLLADLDKLEESLEQYRKAMVIGEKLVTEHPAIPEYKVDLGGAYANTAIKLREGNRPAESLLWFQKAIDFLRPVHESEAKSTKSERYLRNCYEGRSKAYDELRKYTEAEDDWNKYIELSPTESKYRLLTKRWKKLLRGGMVNEAIERISELSKWPTEDSELWYEYACAYSLASGLLPDKKKEYSDRAMDLLTEAVKAGYDNSNQLNVDSDLRPIRDRDDFKKLVADVEAKPKKKKPSTPKSEAKD